MVNFALFIGFQVLLGCSAPSETMRPANYDSFVSVAEYPGLNEAVAAGKPLYLPTRLSASGEPEVYEIDNPILIDQEEPFILHGNAFRVTLTRKNKQAPFFIVRRAPYVNFERLLFDCGAYPEILHSEAIRFENQTPVRVEIQQVRFKDGAVTIAGPGTYVLQRTGTLMRGLLHAGILIDHPEAEVYVTSGGGQNAAEPAILKSEDIYWIWCKRGHLEIYGCFPAGFTRGRADIRIDSPSPKGAHILAFNRTEGTKLPIGPVGEGVHGKLLYVPPSDLPIHVALKANLLAFWDEAERALADYNAAGTLWLIGNQAFMGNASLTNTASMQERLVPLAKGNAPQATVAALGNTVMSTNVLGDITACTKIAGANLVNNRLLYMGLPEGSGLPSIAFLPDTGDISAMPPVPESNPPLLDCIPVGDTVPPALDLVSVKTFGAMGDGITDDTAALQAAFDSPEVFRLFFPPGTYITTKPLDLRMCKSTPNGGWTGAGGWIAGAGAEKTRIKNINGGMVIDGDGIYWVVIQGIAFETVDQRDLCFSLDKVTGHTSSVIFYDCRFIGGSVGMGIAMKTGPNCEHIFHNRCVFENADIGYAMGNPNALMNLVCNSTFRNNRINFAHRWRENDGSLTNTRNCWGNFGVVNARFIGTKEKDFDFEILKMRHFIGIRSDSPMICDSAAPSQYYDMQLFENCEWTQVSEVFYRNGKCGGPIFLRSKTNGKTIEIISGNNGLGTGFAINLDSDLGGVGWPDPVVKFQKTP